LYSFRNFACVQIKLKWDVRIYLQTTSHKNISTSHYKMILELDEFRELNDVAFKMHTPDERLPQNSVVFILYICCIILT